MGSVLVRQEGKVEDWPHDHSRAELAEGFEVEGVDAGVERAADEPVIEDVAGVAGENFVGEEGGDVAVEGKGRGEDQCGSYELEEVVPDEGPEPPVETVFVCHGCAVRGYECERFKACLRQLVASFAPPKGQADAPLSLYFSLVPSFSTTPNPVFPGRIYCIATSANQYAT